jgi:hypothetical protein
VFVEYGEDTGYDGELLRVNWLLWSYFFLCFKFFLKRIKIFLFFLFQVNIFLVFLDYFDVLISKIIFLKIKNIILILF